MIRFPPKRILVAFDLSAVSRAAWKHATALAAACGADVEAAYVEPWEPGVDMMPVPSLAPPAVRELRSAIRRVVGEGTRITILSGDPAHRILALARRRHADLIVVGTHGRKGLRRAVLGSTAEALIRRSPVPVLAARGPVRPVRSILAPVNFTPYAENGLAYAAAASAALSARLKILHVTDDPIWSGNLRFRLSGLIARLPEKVRQACRPTAETMLGATAEGIVKAGRGQDWIVLVPHSRSLVKDAFFGTTLEQVLRRSPLPVLSVPAPGRSAPRLDLAETSRGLT